MEPRLLFTIKDCDFGDVDVVFFPKYDLIIVGWLFIWEIPDNYSNREIMTAWDLYKRHGVKYGMPYMVRIFYREIAQGDSFFRDRCSALIDLQ